MIAADMFGHLSNGELVEENQAYRNRGNGSFAPAPQWQLGSTASGRGMVMARSGRRRRSGHRRQQPARLCPAASRISFAAATACSSTCVWDGAANRHAIGAQLALHTDAGILRRDVRASGGYLSGDPTRVHFGVPGGRECEALEITWPDGAVSSIMAPPNDRHLTVTRSDP